jgi:translation elongation factor EF-1beta
MNSEFQGRVSTYTHKGEGRTRQEVEETGFGLTALIISINICDMIGQLRQAARSTAAQPQSASLLKPSPYPLDY